METNDKKIYLNDTVFFQDSMSEDLCYGIVTGMTLDDDLEHIILTVEQIKPVGEPFDSKSYKYAQGKIGAHNCFHSVGALKNAIAADVNARREVYRKQINSVEDLILFVLKHDVSGESFNVEFDDTEKYHDVAHRRAVFVEKAEMLLGIKNLPVKLPDI